MPAVSQLKAPDVRWSGRSWPVRSAAPAEASLNTRSNNKRTYRPLLPPGCAQAASPDHVQRGAFAADTPAVNNVGSLRRPGGRTRNCNLGVQEDAGGALPTVISVVVSVRLAAAIPASREAAVPDSGW